jgi:hypothetical protein
MAEIRSVAPSRYLRDAFRRFFAQLPRAYCLVCLSRLFEEPPETIREFLAGVAGAATYCPGCRKYPIETFRPRTFDSAASRRGRPDR